MAGIYATLGYRLIALALMLVGFDAVADEGPYAPACPNCPQYAKPPYPHSGLWHNPHRSGTGINIDIQNGIATAIYYGYRDDGSPVWYIASGELVHSEQQDVYWTLDADLVETNHVEPVNGNYQPPEHEVVGRLHLDVLQRHLISFTINDGSAQRMVPLMFGSHSTAPFKSFDPQIDFRIPNFEEGRELDVEGDLPDTPWMIVELNPQGGSRWSYAYSSVYPHWGRLAVGGDGSSQIVMYSFSILDNPPHIIDGARIYCGTTDQLAERFSNKMKDMHGDHLMCIAWSWGLSPPGYERSYFMPIGNMGDRRFTAVSDDGWILEGFRLSYD